ncbi:NAD(P)-dependent alcohol dehydrogenase [Marinobacteraceae bacterium S3BR75-40.1]
MNALIYRRFGAPDVLEWQTGWPDREPAAGEVKVRVVAGALNPKDILLRKGKFQGWLTRKRLPRGCGFDLAGEVVNIGSGVTRFKPGDRVFGMTNAFCGGVHAQYAVLPADELAPAPASLSLEEASALPLAGQTALQALRDCGHLVAGQRVLINGASGGVGHFAVQIAKALGAEVTALCSEANHAFVTALGADHCIDYRQQRPVELEQIFDIIFDVFGNYSAKAFARQLGKHGIYISTIPSATTFLAEARARMGLGKRSRLVIVHSNRADLEQLQRWVESGQLRPHLDARYPVRQAAEAHQHIESRHTRGKVVLTMTEELSE